VIGRSGDRGIDDRTIDDRAIERPVVVAFGSNLGDRRAGILAASDAVGRLLANFNMSSLVETAPVGEGLENDPPYLNAVGVGTSDRPVRELFHALREIERAAGRTRPYPGAPRTLDLDLILAGDAVIDDGDLQVPHPRFRERLFVLDPLLEVARDLVDPVTGLTVRQLRDRLK
jgi:2-amino-4-hydroxy-6-hydroxymethyldihydropteridine diphosphokinase